MNDTRDDMEARASPVAPRPANKKMKKRKQLDTLIKFRPSKVKPNYDCHDTRRSSEDELFLQQENVSITKT